MRESLPAKLLLQLLQATPEQLAAIQRILDGPPAADQAEQPGLVESPQPEMARLSSAAKIIQLLEALRSRKRRAKAAPVDVFLLRYRQNLSRRQIARECKCSESLIAQRLRSIRRNLPWQPRQLHELSPHVEAMQTTLSDPRARNLYRKGAAYGSEEHTEAED